MRVPLSWLQDFAPFEGDWRMLAAALDGLGLVVEAVEHVGSSLTGVRTARVREVAAIDGADRIRRVVVDTGDDVVQVVCGAWNFGPGDVVALAEVGAELPGGMRIDRRRMKGVESNGMLCSARELGLGDDHAGILVLQGGDPVGASVADVLGVRPDVVFDVAVETNRPDALSVAGVARDLAAAVGLPFTVPEPAPAVVDGPPTAERIGLSVIDDDLCPRFTVHVLGGVAVGPSPWWVQRRLALAGMRPINNVVDASNYVMLELGQPTHPYDLGRLAGPALAVRAARPGEQVVTLDGATRALGGRAVAPGDDRRDCVICDGHDQPIGIAGVMGGASTEIGPQTTEVALEAAYFDPMAIARTSKRLALRTEASARFERGCDPEGIDRAVVRLVAVLAESCPTVTVAPDALDHRGAVPAAAQVLVRTERVNAVLGTSIDTDEVVRVLEPLGFSCRVADAGPGTGTGARGVRADGVLTVTVPTFRPDTTREIDVIEEVARHIGYNRIPRRRLRPPQVGRLTSAQRARRSLRQVMAALGADEVWTASMLPADAHERAGLGPEGIAVANPQTPDEAVLRRSLLPGVLRAVAHNRAVRLEDVRVFEIGRVFPPPDGERLAGALAHGDPALSPVAEGQVLGLALAGPADDARSAVAAWCALADALAVVGWSLRTDSGPGGALDPAADGADGHERTGALPWEPLGGGLHPGRWAGIVDRGGQVLGVVGEVDGEVAAGFGVEDRRIGWLQVDLDRLVAAAGDAASTVVAPSRFPTADVDLAFVVERTVPAETVRRALVAAAAPVEATVALFDAFVRPTDGQRSLTFRLRFGADDRTLTDVEIQRARQRCVDAATAMAGVRLR